MKIIQIIALLLLTGLAATAQNYGEIKGRILDGETGAPLSFASVYVDKGTTQLGGFADENGRFRIKPLALVSTAFLMTRNQSNMAWRGFWIWEPA